MVRYPGTVEYSEKYKDSSYEYRHVTITKPMYQKIVEHFAAGKDSHERAQGSNRLLKEQEWRGLGITQSMGWEHYEVYKPEPHVLLFRRPLKKNPISSNNQMCTCA